MRNKPLAYLDKEQTSVMDRRIIKCVDVRTKLVLTVN
jgi:hypothetical protein